MFSLWSVCHVRRCVTHLDFTGIKRYEGQLIFCVGVRYQYEETRQKLRQEMVFKLLMFK